MAIRHYVRLDSTWFALADYPLPSKPVLLTDSTQTIQWLSEKPTKNETAEHDGKTLKAAYWAPIQVND
jgi:hypothetical protein